MILYLTLFSFSLEWGARMYQYICCGLSMVVPLLFIHSHPSIFYGDGVLIKKRTIQLLIIGN